MTRPAAILYADPPSAGGDPGGRADGRGDDRARRVAPGAEPAGGGLPADEIDAIMIDAVEEGAALENGCDGAVCGWWPCECTDAPAGAESEEG